MAKKLAEMTLKELWQLFPIFLTEHRDVWADWYREERETLMALLPADAVINHIGSTAIPGIWAKPIIDILVEFPGATDLGEIKDILVRRGCLCMAESPERVSLNRGYTENGFAEKVFHVHLRHAGDHDEILFRDYLTARPEVAREYEKLKLGLWKRFEHDRDGYTDAKTAFITGCLREARRAGAASAGGDR